MNKCKHKKLFFFFFIIILIVYIKIYYFQLKAINSIEDYFYSDFDNATLAKTYYKEQEAYVIYVCHTRRHCGGWGDRLKGIMSAYAISLLLKRRFLIKILRPCPLEKYLLPNIVKWHDDSVTGKLTSDKIEKIISKNNYSEYMGINTFCMDKFVSQHLPTVDIFEHYNTTKKYILFFNNIDYLWAIGKNPSAQSTLVKLGHNPSKFKIQYLFHTWYNKIFKLNPRLDAKYRQFLAKIKQNKDTKLICAQVRVGEGADDFTKIKNIPKYWDYIIQNYLNKTENDNYQIFVTTDRDVVFETLYKKFNIAKIIRTDGKPTHLDIKPMRRCEIENNDMDKIFLDFHSLQNCDMAIVSQSGFGKLGVWNRIEPNKDFAIFSKAQVIFTNTTDNLWV